MTQLMLGLLAFAVLLTLWVVLPHRVIHHRRNENGSHAAPSAPAEGEGLHAGPQAADHHQRSELRTLGWRPQSRAGAGRRVVGLRITRPAIGEGSGSAAYVLAIDLTGINGSAEARIPVYKELTRMSHVLRKERYSAEVAGLRLTAGNLQALESLVREALGWLLDGQRLPQFWFLVDGRAAVPVFQRVGAYAARVRGGPEIAGPTLAAVREKVGAYQERTDLRVRALSVHDLRYHDAYAIVERGGAWIPIFDEGGKLRTPDLDVRSPQAGLLPFLRALVDAYGPAGPAVHDALVLTCVSEQAWAELLTDRSPSEFALSMPDADARRRISVEVLRLDGRLACSLDGPAEAAGTGATHRVLLAGDVWTLAEVLGRELEQRAVARRDEIRIHRMADAIGGVR